MYPQERILPGEVTAGRLYLRANIEKATKRDSQVESDRRGFALLLLVFCALSLLYQSIGVTIPNTLLDSPISLERRQDSGDDLSSSTTATATPTSTVLSVFQVAPPLATPSGEIVDESVDGNGDGTRNGTKTTGDENAACRVTLMEYEFANSFGSPFVGDYKPPSCIDNANTVIMNFTVTSKGVQFDRLALMYLGDTEVWRTSTAEPLRNGIVWEYQKDMSQYLSMWKAPQKIIFDLANIVTSNYTGTYNTTLTATFFNADQPLDAADLVIPISTRQGLNASAASVFAIPTVNATNTITFPRNANRAVFSVSSCGQGTEEFWWSNSLQSDTRTFVGGTIPGFSPFRELQVYIDGQLAGVQWPYPVIFTGGVVPGLWTPIVGIDAFDLQEYEIDISAWLGVLCDGNEHTFSMKVAGLQDDGKTTASISSPVATSWSVTGKIFIWLDDTNSITTGDAPTITSADPTIAVSQSHTQNSTGANETLTYTTSVSRSITINSIITSEGGSKPCSWTQVLTHTDEVNWSDFGNTQTNRITTSGTDSSTGPTQYSRTYSYPLTANTTAFATTDGNITLSALISRSKILSTSRSSIYPSGLQAFAYLPQVSQFTGTTMMTMQNSSATQFQSVAANVSFEFSSGNQEMRLGGMSASGTMGMPDVELYFRNVETVNRTVTRDEERKGAMVVTDFSVSANETGNADFDVLAIGRSSGLQALDGAQKEALLRVGI